MNKPRALVVEDDERLAESIGETIRHSLSHEFDHVTNQTDALAKLTAAHYDYVLLDLQIPARPNRGGASHEFGVNLLRAIREQQALNRLPVIIMTAHHSKCVDNTSELIQAGATEFISKPFPEAGRTLAVVIRGVLKQCGAQQLTHVVTSGDLKAFEGGDLTFYEDRIELCGVTVVSSRKSSQMWSILNALNQPLGNGRYKAFPGSALGSKGGQNSVAGSVRDFRRYAAEQLGRELGLKVEPHDVIETSSAGYRLNARIVVKDLRRNSASKKTTCQTVLSSIADPVGQRREQILAVLRGGEHLRAPAIANRLFCPRSTIKRDLDALRADGRILFTGPSKTGHYTLVDTALPSVQHSQPSPVPVVK